MTASDSLTRHSAAAGSPEDGVQVRADARTRRRFARRQLLRRWRMWRWLLVGVGLLGLVAGSIWVVWFSDHLLAEEVRVSGTDYLTEQHVVRAAKVPLGEPLANVDLDTIDTRLRALAAVRSVEVSKVWPHTVRIVIHERTAVAVVGVGEELRGMDAEGVLFRTYPNPPGRLPRIQTQGTGVDTEVLREAAQVLGALPPEVSRRVVFCSVQSIDQIRLTLRDGREVLWGSAEGSSDKGRVLAALLERRARYYDVSVPGLPTYR